jgi:HEAT repeat protein
MVLNKFIGQGIFFFTRACAHAFENSSKQIVFSAFLLALPNLLIAATKDELISKLNSASDPVERIGYLAQLNAAHLEAKDLPKIDSYLTDEDARVRAQSVAVMGSIGGKKVTDALISVLQNDTDAGVRMAAAFWLGSKKSVTPIAALEKAMLEDGNDNVRVQAAQALKTIGARSSLRKASNDKDKRVKKLANE